MSTNHANILTMGYLGWRIWEIKAKNDSMS